MAEWTRKRACHHSRRRIAKIKDSLGQVALNWGDLDDIVVEKIEEVAGMLDELDECMDESVIEEEMQKSWEGTGG
jgi:hypothetical protein